MWPREMMHHRHYTVDEANAKLDLVGRIVRRIRDARRQLAAEGFNPQFVSLADVVVRDLERGLIDFPSLLGGEEIYLCWLLDEPEVGHWHAPESGFGGRRPL